MHRFVLALVVLVCVAGCASVRDLVPGLLGGSASDLAEQVVIQRDAAGTPHVVGQSDAAAVFGLAYALAEDDFAAIDAAVLDALGRSAERLGAAGVADDVVRRAFQVSAYARAEYAAEPAERQALWDAWAAGLNRYLADHPGTPAYVGRFEPWHLFAVSRPVDAELVVDGVPVRDVVALALGAEAPDGAGPADGTANAAEGEAGLRSTGEAGLGTAGEDGLRTAWALAPERTADAGTLLLARRTPAGPDAGPVWDASVRSASGWHFAGPVAPGQPLPSSGANAHLAWAHTTSGLDHADAIRVLFDDPANALHYRWEDRWRTAETWADSVRVRTTAGVETRHVSFLRTHLGPVIRRAADSSATVVRLARHEHGGALQQRLAMQRADGLDAFWAAHAAMAIPGLGTVYTDAAGNILYVPAGAVPRHAAGGGWDGYHALDQVPYLFNPRSGWLHGGPGSPADATAAGAGPDTSGLPAYMRAPAEPARTAWLREVLGGRDGWTAATLAAAASATRVGVDPALLDALVRQWERVGALDHVRAEALDDAIEALRAWDGRVEAGSAAATLYVLLTARLEADTATGSLRHLEALEGVLATLRQSWGTEVVPWQEAAAAGSPVARAARQLGMAAPALRVTAFAAAGPAIWVGTLEGALRRLPFTAVEVEAATVERYRPGGRGTGDAGETGGRRTP